MSGKVGSHHFVKGTCQQKWKQSPHSGGPWHSTLECQLQTKTPWEHQHFQEHLQWQDQWALVDSLEKQIFVKSVKMENDWKKFVVKQELLRSWHLMHESMKMVCPKGHFLVFIRKDTKEDHEKKSPFHGIPISSLMEPKPRWQWLTTLWQMEYWCSPWWSQRQFRPKWGWSTTFKWKVKVSTILFPFKSIMELSKIPHWGCDLIINHGHIFWNLNDF
jgi:hypothetical protein